MLFKWETFAAGEQQIIFLGLLVFSTVCGVGVGAVVLMCACTASSLVLNLGQFCPLGGIWQCLEVPLVITMAGCEGVMGI